MAKPRRRIVERRGPGSQPNPARARALRPATERLESRRLLATAINTIGGGSGLTNLSAIVAGPDGALWFTEGGSQGENPLTIPGSIDRVTTSGAITRFTAGIAPGDVPAGITSGPDGALWFTEAGSNRIGRITTAGSVTTYPIRTANAIPGSIVTGPDGNLWFTEGGSGKIGRITTAGAITEFTIPSGSPSTPAEPFGITQGRDSALWFTADLPSGGVIGRITPGGSITEFPIPPLSNTTPDQPVGIAPGPNNDDLWFASIGEIGRITTGGNITDFGFDATGIADGPDFALYFTDSGSFHIGRIATDGSVLLLPVPDSATSGIASGPDGNVWFTEISTGAIGQLVLPQASVIAAASTSFKPIVGHPFTGIVATFRDRSSLANPTNFQATIDYGDGQTGPGTITEDASDLFTVVGTHVYAAPGTFKASVTIANDAGSTAVPLSITARYPIPPTVNGHALDAIADRRSNTAIADLTTANGEYFSTATGATVAWGDGTSSPAVLRLGLNNTTDQFDYSVFAGHVYAQAGTYHPVVTVTFSDNLSSSGTATVVVAAAPAQSAINEAATGAPTPGTGADQIVDGPDGKLWFIESADPTIGVADTAGHVVEFSLPTPPNAANFPPGPVSITSGPDGALWFIIAASIGRITTAGAVTYFTQTSINSPGGITLGPDGALWFSQSDSIGRITTAGVVTVFPEPTQHASGSIVAGPDGALWFTELGGGIGRVTTAGAFTEFATGLPTFTVPSDLIDGPDGNLWFIGGDSIGRITTSGVVTRFSGVNIVNPTSIASGPDGALYFTEDGNPNNGGVAAGVARITSAGIATAPFSVLTPNAPPKGIVAGPDGNVYFTEPVGDRIGQLVLPQSSVIVTDLPPATGEPFSLSGTVVKFRDRSALANATNFRASIDYGDGQSGTATINPDGSASGTTVFDVVVDHDYGVPGTYHIVVTILNDAGSIAVPVTVVVAPAAVSAYNLYPTEGSPFSTLIAEFDDPFGYALDIDPRSVNYVASIDWGDGTPASAATFERSPADPFDEVSSVLDLFSGGHAYAQAGLFTVTTTIRAPDGTFVGSAAATAFVTPAGPIGEAGIGINGSPTRIVAGPDGALWFTETRADPRTGAIGRITTSSVVTEYLTASVSDIATGPDGNLWLTEPVADAIGRITPSGAITTFAASPSPGAEPLRIVAGPDGNLWFTENALGRIGRITTSGVVTQFPIAANSGSPVAPVAITPGPDGALWFTLPSVNEIGRINTSGIITEFPAAGVRLAVDGSIVAGPDGAIWFTAVGAVGRITTSGLVTSFRAGLFPDSAPSGIVAGPDGNLYFTDPGAGQYDFLPNLEGSYRINDPGVNRVDRITTAGAITALAIPTFGSMPGGIALGPDGNLWFTEGGKDQIGKLVIPATAPVESITGQGTPVSAVEGVPFSGTLATVTDTVDGQSGDPSAFIGGVDWGDGTSDMSFTIVPTGTPGEARVVGSHTYDRPGTYSILIDLINPYTNVSGGTSTTATVAPSFVVVNTDDDGPGSLRRAIENSEQVQGATITFAIPASMRSGALATIAPASPLPSITTDTTIDATTQAAFEDVASASPLIEIDGRGVGGTSSGLVLTGPSDHSRVLGLSVFGFVGPQIELDSFNATVQGDYLGLRADGSMPGGGSAVPIPSNTADGLLIRGGGQLIGGLGPGLGNVISGNPGQGIDLKGLGQAAIFGDIIGLDPSGESARPNGFNGIAAIGANGSMIGPGNLISGNGAEGIALVGSTATITGDAIGTDATMTRAIGNGLDGILVQGSDGVVISDLSGIEDVISGNARAGILIEGGSTLAQVRYNLIGTDGTGTRAIGNGLAGVVVLDSPGNVIGPGDLVSGNGSIVAGAGVWIDGPASTGNLVVGDRIGTDLSGQSAIGNNAIGVLIDEAPGNSIGGSAFGESNLISGNTVAGLMIAGAGASGNLVQANLIGPDLSGTRAIGNGTGHQGVGLYLMAAPTNQIGGPFSNEANVISGNPSDGVQVVGPGAAGNLIQGNKIGTDVSGLLPLGNGADGLVIDQAPGSQILGNLVAANAENGITISGGGATGTQVRVNTIGRDAAGRALGDGGYGLAVYDGAKGTTAVGNTIGPDALGPAHGIAIAQAGSKSTTEGRAKVTVKSATFTDRAMPKLQGIGTEKGGRR